MDVNDELGTCVPVWQLDRCGVWARGRTVRMISDFTVPPSGGAREHGANMSFELLVNMHLPLCVYFSPPGLLQVIINPRRHICVVCMCGDRRAWVLFRYGHFLNVFPITLTLWRVPAAPVDAGFDVQRLHVCWFQLNLMFVTGHSITWYKCLKSSGSL